MPKYLKLLPKPFLDDLVAGNCIPFVGAGFSRNAAVDGGGTIPDWDTLGRAISDQIGDAHDYTTALDAISTYVHAFDKSKLVEELTRLLYVGTSHPAAAHKAFAQIPFRFVVTTNFEMLLEDAYTQVPKYCHVIIGEEPLSQNIQMSTKSVTLLKMHGDVRHPIHLVATEDDYDEFLGRYPLLATFVASLLIQKTLLFVGYSLSDPHFRMIWQLIGTRLKKLRRRAYTFAISPSQQMIDQFWRRGVRVIALPGSLRDADSIFAEVFKEIEAYWNNYSTEHSIVTADDPKAEIIASAASTDASSRICLFDSPAPLVAFYKENLYPIAERHGFAPMSLADVLIPGDSITAILNGLIERASAIVIDIGSGRSILDVEYIRNRATTTNIAVIRDANEVNAETPDGTFLWLGRPDLTAGRYETFLNILDDWFTTIAQRTDERRLLEPERLLKKGEARAAFISAFSLLESALRNIPVPDDSTYLNRSRAPSMQQIVRIARQADLIDDREAQEVVDLYRLRSKIIHEDLAIDRKQLRGETRFLLEIAKRIRTRLTE